MTDQVLTPQEPALDVSGQNPPVEQQEPITEPVQTPEEIQVIEHQKKQKEQKSFFDMSYNKGKDSAHKHLAKELGTNDINQIKEWKLAAEQIEKLKNGGQPDPTIHPKVQEQMDILAKQNADLVNQLTSEKEGRTFDDLKRNILSKVNEASPKNKKIADIVTNEFLQNYKVVDGKVFDKTGETPEFFEGKQATVENIIFNMKKGEWNEFFNKAEGPGHINGTSRISTPEKYEVTDKDMGTPAFVKAMQEAGEMENYLTSGIVNKTNIMALMK